MAETKTSQNDFSNPSTGAGQTLRQKAEERLQTQSLAQSAKTPEETSRLLHELEVHQVELEMQNEELRRAQEELEASRARYFDLYDLAPVGYLTLGEQGLILEANFTAARMLGMERDRLVGQPLSRFIFRDDQDIYYLSCKQLFERQTPLTFELRMEGDDDRPFWVQMKTKVAHDSNGALIWWATLSDITEQKRMEGALLKSEARYRSYIEVTGQLGWTTNPDGEVTEDIPSWREFTGQSKEAVKGWGWSKALHPEDLEHAIKMWKNAVATKNHYEVEYRIRRHDRVYRHFLARGVPLFKDDGEILEWVGTCIDITDRKLAESVMQARLRMLTVVNKITISSDEFLQVALDEIEAQTGSTISFYHFLEADQETLSLQNWSTNTLRNMCTAEGKGSHYPISKAGVWVDCVHERRPIIHNDFSSLPQRKGLPQGHAPVIREAVVPIMRDSRIVAIIGVGNKPSDYDQTDINIVLLLGDLSWEIVERMRAEQALRERTWELEKLSDTLELQVRERTADLAKTNEDLRRLSQKLLSAQEEERKRVAGEIHDTLGSCLSAIKFKIEAVLQMIEKTSTATAEYLKPLIPVIQEGIEECRRIQRDLRPPMLDDLGLLPTLSWFCRRFQSIYSTIQVEQEIDIEETDVPDPLKIVVFRVIQEAMNNTAKYSQADLVRQSLRKRGERLELVIRDNGQGFNLEEVNSSERSRKGLGLTSMKERVEFSWGSFSIESAKGKGTVIRAVWPV